MEELQKSYIGLYLGLYRHPPGGHDSSGGEGHQESEEAIEPVVGRHANDQTSDQLHEAASQEGRTSSKAGKY